MKTFDLKDIKSWANCCDVKVGDEGYFADCIEVIKDRVKRGELHTIIKITPDSSSCFTAELGIANYSYGFFLPADKVREEKKKYRPIRTVNDLYAVLDKKYYSSNFGLPHLVTIRKNLPYLVTIRKKIDLTVIYDTVITGWARRDDNTIKYFYMNGSWCLRPDELLKDFEIKINGEWLPFGVEE